MCWKEGSALSPFVIAVFNILKTIVDSPGTIRCIVAFQCIQTTGNCHSGTFTLHLCRLSPRQHRLFRSFQVSFDDSRMHDASSWLWKKAEESVNSRHEGCFVSKASLLPAQIREGLVSTLVWRLIIHKVTDWPSWRVNGVMFHDFTISSMIRFELVRLFLTCTSCSTLHHYGLLVCLYRPECVCVCECCPTVQRFINPAGVR